jgi:hypothetical protein
MPVELLYVTGGRGGCAGAGGVEAGTVAGDAVVVGGTDGVVLGAAVVGAVVLLCMGKSTLSDDAIVPMEFGSVGIVSLSSVSSSSYSCTVLMLIVVSFTLINGAKGSMGYVTESVSNGVAKVILSLLPGLLLPVMVRFVSIDVSCFSCVTLLGASGSIGAVVVGCWIASSMSVIPAAMRSFVLAMGMGTLVGNQSTVSDMHSALDSQSQNV